ncbi:hypothetical protein Q3G72_022048 [Acer saccharum]|nr:hypothetical protein Q3G72_022048 [Acer saccharum]
MEVPMAERAGLVFHNKMIDGTAIKRLISRLIDHFGMAYTSHILDQVKTLGFQQATATSISLGIDDLLTIPSKGWLVQDAEQQSFILEKHHQNVHAVEKLRQSIEIWYATSEYLRQEMNPNFRMTDPFNPVHIMSFSGARGNASQVHQLVGMRGLMSDPQGQMIDLPIQSNLREGLSLTEYIISCYGARKGVVDTAVRTSDAGYLTRRLVEVVQHIVVRRTDCGTIRGIYDLQFLHSAINDLWIFVGYFNAIIGAHERLGGEIPTCAYFSEAISSLVPPVTLKWLDPIKPELPLFPRQPLYRAKQEFEFVLIITEASSCLFLSSNQRGTRVAITFLFFAFVVLIRYDRSESASRSSLRSSRIDESLRTGWIDGFLKPSFDQWIPFLSSPAGLQLP